MSDKAIFLFGMLVFGVCIASTICMTVRPEGKRRKEPLESTPEVS